MSDLMTVAEVAAYFRHPDPASHAAAMFVSRLVDQGLPCIVGMRPRRFVRDHVAQFALELATMPAPTSRPANGRTPRPRVERGSSPSSAPIASLVARLKAAR